LELHVKDGDGESLGSCDISPENIVMDFVGAAAVFLTELTKDSYQRKNVSTEVDEGVHIDDHDSVLGSQTQDTADLPEQDAGRKTPSWEAFRESNIPPCIRDVSFTINDEDLTPEVSKRLRDDYPGVNIVTPSTKAKEDTAREARAKEMPKGVKQMTIELEESEATQTPGLEQSLRKMYPWALIESKPGPNISKKRARRMTESDAATPPRPDPIKHIEDFAAYVLEPPTDDEFGYQFPLSEDWDRLTYARKFEIAHARAIHNFHGKVVDGKGCCHCALYGHQCKVYLPQLGNLTHIAFGNVCQHCRLRRTRCDLSAAMPVSPSTPTAPAALRLDTHNVQDRGDPTETPPLTTAKSRSLGPRVGSFHGPREEDDNYTPTNVSPNMHIIELADMIHLFRGMPYKVRNVIYSMWDLLRSEHKVEPYGRYPSTLEQYYENLINLYILTYLREEYDLAFIVLLHFQNTNYQETTQIPTINNAVRAFEYLPTHAPLCRWIVIVLSFLWDTQGQGQWDNFVNTNPEIKSKTRAVAKLLHGICYVRDPYTRGGDIEVRRRWCIVHNHMAGPADQKKACEDMMKEFGPSAEDVQKRWREREIEEAHETLALLANGSGFGSAAGPSSLRIGEKRRADASPMSRPYKVGRGGRGRGRARGPGR
jgi:hypothetical protein